MSEIRVGAWRIEPQLNRVSSGDTVLQLEPRVIDLLSFLAERPGEVVGKKELLDRVWGDVHITEGVLKRAIWELRRSLGDDAKKPRLIETIPRRGYRLIAQPPAEPQASVVTEAASPPRTFVGALAALAAIVLLSLLAGLAAWRRPPVEPEAPRPQIVRPVTALEGRELHPALSADGSRLAFAWNGGYGDDFDLYVKLIGSEHLQRLTQHPGVDSQPTWSSDGNHLAFVRQAADLEESGIFLVSALGGPTRQLLAIDQGQVTGLAWSPRGDELAIALAPEGQASALHLLSLDTLELSRLTEPPAASVGDRDPAFSPDGGSLAFVRASSWHDQDIFQVALKGGQETRLTALHATLLGLAWTDDGSALTYSSDHQGPRSLWRVAADGGDSEWLSAGGEGALHPSSDRSGRRLAFEQIRCDSDIQRVGDASPGDTATVISTTRRDQFPQLSPDGRYLAFVSTRDGSYQIYVAAADGSAVRRLTDLEGSAVTALRWAPDGTRIAFEIWHRGRGDVQVVEVVSGRVHQIAAPDQLKVAPGWSADGKRIYFGSSHSGPWQIWTVPVAGGEPRQVTTEGGRAAVESADGRLLYYTKHRTSGIWRRPVAGGAEEMIVEDFERDNGVDWMLSDDGIYYLAQQQGETGIAFLDFASGQTSLRFRLDQMPHYDGLTLAADRRSVLLTHVAKTDSDVMLLDRSSLGHGP